MSHKNKAIVFVLDGFPNWVVDDLLKEKKLPGFQAIIDRGAKAEYVVPPYPYYTAAGLTTIWTGKTPKTTGIFGNLLPVEPKAANAIENTRNGFEQALPIPPFWELLANQKIKTTVFAGTNSQMREGAKNKSSYLTVIDPLPDFGASSSIVPFKVWTEKDFMQDGSIRPYWNVDIGESHFHLSFHKMNDSCDGFTIGQKNKGNLIQEEIIYPLSEDKNSESAQAFVVNKGEKIGALYFNLLEMAADCSRFTLIQRGVTEVLSNVDRGILEDMLRVAALSYDNTFIPYHEGFFGSTYMGQGIGEAEKKLLQLVKFDIQKQKEAVEYTISKSNDEAIIQYSPITDRAGHSWLGDAVFHIPKLWDTYLEVLIAYDQMISELFQKYGKDYVFFVVSDHGMEPVKKTFAPNELLYASQLIDKVKAPAWLQSALVVNTMDWKGGIVPLDQKEKVLEGAKKVLAAFKDPETNKPVVKDFFTREDLANQGIDAPSQADLYMQLDSNYASTSRFHGDKQFLISPQHSGGHTSSLPNPQTMALFLYGGGEINRHELKPMNLSEARGIILTVLGVSASQKE